MRSQRDRAKVEGVGDGGRVGGMCGEVEVGEVIERPH